MVATWESLTCWDPRKHVKEETFHSLMMQRQDMRLVFTLPKTNVERSTDDGRLSRSPRKVLCSFGRVQTHEPVGLE